MPQNMTIKPEILSVTSVARSRLFHIEQVDLRFSNGKEVQFERLQSDAAGSVLIVPVIDDELILIREYAVGTERYELSFPKGAINDGEEPQLAACRELQEEIGMASRNVRLLRRIIVSPAYINRPTWIMLATDLSIDPLPGDEPEALQQVRWPLNRMWELLEREDFNDGINQLALYVLGHEMKVLPY
ncbi:MAG: ADP compounds hydrolase NudE [Pseudomonadota bacterium]|nr:ADP compounds hydrolase NudE [Pseudomonadota bacterium]